jgi:hypothetical protein
MKGMQEACTHARVNPLFWFLSLVAYRPSGAIIPFKSKAKLCYSLHRIVICI